MMIWAGGSLDLGHYHRDNKGGSGAAVEIRDGEMGTPDQWSNCRPYLLFMVFV